MRTPKDIPETEVRLLVTVIRDLDACGRAMSFSWLLRRVSPGVEEIEECLWAHGDHLDLSLLNENPHARLFFWKERCLDRRRLQRVLERGVRAGFLDRLESPTAALYRPTDMGRDWCELVQSPPGGGPQS